MESNSDETNSNNQSYFFLLIQKTVAFESLVRGFVIISCSESRGITVLPGRGITRNIRNTEVK